MHFSGEHRQQQERKKYSQVHCYLEELMVSKENNDFSTFKLRFPQLITVKLKGCFLFQSCEIDVTSMVELASTSATSGLQTLY